jgi:cell division protein FtsB
MASERKARAGSVGVGSLILALALCLFFCGAGIGYVWHCNRNEQLGRDIRARAQQLQQLRAENLVLDGVVDRLRTPEAIEAGAKRWNLGLVMPQPQQILRITAGKGGGATNAAVLRMAGQP